MLKEIKTSANTEANTIKLSELQSKAEKKFDLTEAEDKKHFDNFLYFAFSHREFRKIITTEVDNYMNRLTWWRIADTVCHGICAFMFTCIFVLALCHICMGV